MVVVQVLETFVLASIGLGSAVFILVAILPTILPGAISAAMREIEKLQAKARVAPGGDIATSRKSVEEIQGISERLTTLMSDIRGILKVGFLSAGLLILSGIIGLIYLALPPLYGPQGTAFAPVSEAADWILGISFALGLLTLLLFMASFYRIASIALHSSSPDSNSESQSGLVGGR